MGTYADMTNEKPKETVPRESQESDQERDEARDKTEEDTNTAEIEINTMTGEQASKGSALPYAKEMPAMTRGVGNQRDRTTLF